MDRPGPLDRGHRRRRPPPASGRRRRDAGPPHLLGRYTAGKTGDRTGMRQLGDEAEAIAADLGPTARHVEYGGGFSPARVQIYRISAEFSAGDPTTALSIAQALPSGQSPTARYFADVAAAHAHRGDRDECLRALLAAEHFAAEEIYSRPVVRALITGYWSRDGLHRIRAHWHRAAESAVR